MPVPGARSQANGATVKERLSHSMSMPRRGGRGKAGEVVDKLPFSLEMV